MIARRSANRSNVNALLDLIERRFGLRLPTGSARHLQEIRDHYKGKRQLLRWELGDAAILESDDYAKSVMISEAARLLLREIDPWPRRKKAKKGRP